CVRDDGEAWLDLW
nr:immunoglobulin heavy chain junction region [Macaca mulatta]